MKPGEWEVTGTYRVQNRELWKKYCHRREELDRKSGGSLNERLLFHGTDPASLMTIAREGFDDRVSNLSGALGAGTYYAQSSAYSHSYGEYRTPTWKSIV
eukprot:scaffold2552_cov380-Prasinococcus_capsulatus_cf.AAC.43